jgi:hypothetical protein
MLITQLFETPIEDLSLHGNWNKNSSYKEQDRKLLTNPKAQEKIKQQWINTKIPFNIYFVNSPEANRYVEVGEVSRNWLYQNMPIFYSELVKSGKITSREFLDENAINVIFTNNKGSERVPMTGWIIAHRLCHSLYRKNGAQGGNADFRNLEKHIKEYLKDIFSCYNYDFSIQNPDFPFDFRSDGERNINMIKFFQVIGTMKSARENKIRTPFEFYCELVAQYLITGSIKFNPAPDRFRGYKNIYYYTKNLDYVNSDLQAMKENIENDIEIMLDAAIGKAFVM